MPHTSLVRRTAPVFTAAVAALAIAIPGALEAQQGSSTRPVADAVMVGTTKTTVTVTDAASGATTTLAPSLMREVYVGAFRSSARQWCAAGGATALDDALRSTTSIVEQNVSGAERAATLADVAAQHAQMRDAGGCASLVRPGAIVVVDGFDGHRWRETRRSVVGGAAGSVQESGLTVVTRGVKIGGRRFGKLSADADFAFTTQRGELVNGRYRVPVSDATAEERWATVEGWIAEQYPTLRVVRAQAPERGAREAQGDGPATGAGVLAGWSTDFQNPDTHALEVRMTLRADGAGRGTIVVDYVGFAGR